MALQLVGLDCGGCADARHLALHVRLVPPLFDLLGGVSRQADRLVPAQDNGYKWRLNRRLHASN